ncbi:MAG: hypothetical protein J6A16_03275, partial [Oscillospiraceae bacterium]|nr:hypothetical protein [Oscillospiraceae bacterium]
LAGSIPPEELAKYLIYTGWKEMPTKRVDIKRFIGSSEEGCYQIIIPIDRTLSDYKIAMYDAILTLSSFEHKKVEQIILYLLNPNTDIIKIRVANDKVEQGNITLDDAVQLYDNAKKLISAAASEVINPKKFYSGRVDEKINKFMSMCRFGQTEIGSYVVSVVCPFAEITDTSDLQLTLFTDEQRCADSLTRQITNKVFQNIFSVKDQIDRDSHNQLIEDFESHHISSNFLDALNGINLYSDDTIVEYYAEWSPVVKTNRFHQTKIQLSHSYYDKISYISQELKKQASQDIEIIGRVSSLKAAPNIETRTSGTVIITYIGNDNRPHSANTILGKNDYDIAIQAHQNGKYVKAIGELNRNTLTCNSFEIIE